MMEEMNYRLSTERIRLRAPEPDDLAVMDRVENDASLVTFLVATGPYSRYWLAKYIRQNTNDLFADLQLRLMIEYKADGCVAGIIDVFDFSPRYRRAELGIYINKEYRRKGIAREALRLLEQHCACLGVHQLYLYVLSENVPCIRFFHSQGYERAAVLKDWFSRGETYYEVQMFQKILSAES